MSRVFKYPWIYLKKINPFPETTENFIFLMNITCKNFWQSETLKGKKREDRFDKCSCSLNCVIIQGSGTDSVTCNLAVTALSSFFAIMS